MPKSVSSGSAAKSEDINGRKEVNFDRVCFFFIPSVWSVYTFHGTRMWLRTPHQLRPQEFLLGIRPLPNKLTLFKKMKHASSFQKFISISTGGSVWASEGPQALRRTSACPRGMQHKAGAFQDCPPGLGKHSPWFAKAIWMQWVSVVVWCYLLYLHCADSYTFPFHSSRNSPIWSQWGRRQQVWTGHNVGCKFSGKQFSSENDCFHSNSS